MIVKLWENEEFHGFVDAVYDSEAVEGSMDVDDVFAAQMIRDYARKNNNEELASKKLDAIIRAMKVGLRRYGQDRKRRGEGGDEPAANEAQTVQ